MDITTVNDRHLYEGHVAVRDSGDPSGHVQLTRRIVRFGPPGWLTVVADLSADADIELYPACQVLSVSRLREVGPTRPNPGGEI